MQLAIGKVVRSAKPLAYCLLSIAIHKKGLRKIGGLFKKNIFLNHPLR